MIVIGLTGGIASGKTTVASLLGERGAQVIDADVLGHLAYEKGSGAHAAIVAAFGPDILASDGSIDRKALGSKVFGRPDELNRLTDIVWPEIRRLAVDRIAMLAHDDPDAIIVLEAAVLLEAGWESLVDEIWMTRVDRETAIARAVARGGVDEVDAAARVDAQLSNEERSGRARVVIDNSGELPALEAEIEKAWSDLQERIS